MTTEPRVASAGRQGVQSLERALDLLESLAEAGTDAGLSDLAAQTGLPSPTIHRLLQTLVARGYVRQDAARRYALGPRLIGLSDASHRMLGVWAEPFLQALAADAGETVNLAVLDGDHAFNVAQALPHHGLRMYTEIGRQIMVHCTAAGKVMIAQMAPEEVDALIARVGAPRATSKTITDGELLHRELRAIREAGFAVDDGEQEVGVRCVAVPVSGLPQRAAVTVAGPEARFTRALSRDVVPKLQAVATEFSEWMLR